MNQPRRPRGTPSGGQFAAGARAESGAEVAVDTSFFPSAPMTTHDVEVLAEYRGRFENGYDSDDINRLFGRLESARLVCVWDAYDDYGYGGNSEFAGIAQNEHGKTHGSWRSLHPDVWTHLSEPDSDVDPETIPSLLSDEVFDGIDLDPLDGDGFHNLAVFDNTGPVCEICGEQTEDRDRHGTLICMDCQEDDEEETCRHDGCEESLDDNEGWDGYCGTHADLVSQHAEGEHVAVHSECPECG